MKRKKIAFFFFFSVYQIGTLVMMSIQKYSPENFSYTIMMIFVYCLGQFPSLLLFFSLVKEIFQDAKLEADLKMLEQQQALRERQLLALQKRKNATQNFQEKITRKLAYLDHCLEEKNYEEALSCYQKLSLDFQKVRFRPCCSDSLINAILDSKKLTAQEHHIQVNYQIFLPEEMELISSSLSCIFFNLMDNGIEACLKSGNSPLFIQLSTRVNGDFIIIHMINSKSCEESFDHKTSKNDSLAHGYGLSIIEEIARDNDGSCEWTDHGTTFESTVMIRGRTQESPAGKI